MLEYIYFVKCPGCEDEHFDFFNEAKDFAMSLLSKKPIITQIEVDRNDFGECVDSCDLGTVWSWEDIIQDTPREPVFTKTSTFAHDARCSGDNSCCCGQYVDEDDPEFASLDNSIDTPVGQIRKPVPADMSIEDLVEEMEENEDTVECKCCGLISDKSDCNKDADYHGWVCSRCQRAIKEKGGSSSESSENDFLNEAFDRNAKVEFTYDGLKVTLQGPKRDVDDWDEAEESVRYSFHKKKDDVATDIWENFIEEVDAKDVEGGLDTLEDDRAWYAFLENHFDDLLDKYYDKLLKYYEYDARKEYEENHTLGEGCAKQKPFLEEFDDAETHRANLTDCPECGARSYDMKEQYCANCGLNL